MLLSLVRQGEKYGTEYVDNIKRQAAEFCLWDVITLGDDIEFETNLQGWWAKIELFRPSLKHLRPFVYIDLDSIVRGDISELGRDDDFYILREWMDGAKPDDVQSSVMIIPKEVDHIWDAFWKEPNKWLQMHGDQDFLKTIPHKTIQDEFPGYVGSYKLHNKKKPVNRIVTFHGRPKMPDAGGWVEDVWIKPSK